MTWTKLCDLSAIPATSLTPFVVDGIGVLLVKGEHTSLVIPPSCPHMASPLADGFFDGSVLTCSKHLWQFAIDDGGRATGIAEADLLTYETKVDDGILYVRLERELQYSHQEEDEEEDS